MPLRPREDSRSRYLRERKLTVEHREENDAKLTGMLAEFRRPDVLIQAAKRLREAGYERIEAYSPFPIHGIDQALRIRPTWLPWLVLGAGFAGGVVALAGQWWTNAVDYPFIISGKPLFSLPANIPVTFEVIILCSAAAAFLGMLLLGGLPRLANPLHGNRRFLRATTDGFFLLIDASDRAFSVETTPALLRSLGAEAMEICREEPSSARLPRPVLAVLATLAVLAVVPPLLIARSRATTSEQPPLRSFKDMDFQPKKKTQTTSRLFADGRAMRPPVPGTVARGELNENSILFRGISSASASPERLTGGQTQSSTDSPAGQESDWTETLPVAASDELMQRGRERFNIFCATCHGRAGDGDGPVSVRALALEQGTWVPPTSLHADHVLKQPDGKLFNTITNGIRKMPGYADQIFPEDRWAIVLYVRALQRTRNASPSDLPASEIATLRELN